jgi:hypothetical protein
MQPHTPKKKEIQKHTHQESSWGVIVGRRVRLTTSPPSVSRLENVEASTSHNPIGLHSLLQGSFTFFYIISACFPYYEKKIK